MPRQISRHPTHSMLWTISPDQGDYGLCYCSGLWRISRHGGEWRLDFYSDCLNWYATLNEAIEAAAADEYRWQGFPTGGRSELAQAVLARVNAS